MCDPRRVPKAGDRLIWTNRSVLRLLAEEESAGRGDTDPALLIADRARRIALEAIEGGWRGPPFDPFELASLRGIMVVAHDHVADARLVPGSPPRIEFNPNRHSARVRFSIAHELAHLLFTDHADGVRYREIDPFGDAWQLEMMCNIAASELLMPAGAFPQARIDDLSLTHLLDLRATYGVSTEAVLRRAIRLTGKPAGLFAATRVDDGARIDYIVASRAWQPRVVSGYRTGIDTMIRRCTAVGFSVDGHEAWAGESLRLQAVGVPPYPSHRFPRVVGLIQPVDSVAPARGALSYVRGDATAPSDTGPMLLVHIVNDRAPRWGGRGFATSLAHTLPSVHAAYEEWFSSESRPRLGEVHFAEANDQLTVASMVAQAGYGEDHRPRVRLQALDTCLRIVADVAARNGAAVHMPLIGTGLGGTKWAPIHDLVVEVLCGANVPVTVYVRPDVPMPVEVAQQMSLLPQGST